MVSTSDDLHPSLRSAMTDAALQTRVQEEIGLWQRSEEERFRNVLKFCWFKKNLEENLERSIPRDELVFPDSFPQDGRYFRLFYDRNCAVDAIPPEPIGGGRIAKAPPIFATFDFPKFEKDFQRYRSRRGSAVKPMYEIPRFEAFQLESMMTGLIHKVERLTVSGAENDAATTSSTTPMEEKFDRYITSLNAVPLLMPVSLLSLMLTRGDGNASAPHGDSKKGLEKAYVSSIFTLCSLKTLYYAELQKRKSNLNVRINASIGRSKFSENMETINATTTTTSAPPPTPPPPSSAQAKKKKLNTVVELEEADSIDTERRLLKTIEEVFAEDLDTVMTAYEKSLETIAETYVSFLQSWHEVYLSDGKTSGPGTGERESFAASRFRYLWHVYQATNYKYWVGLINAHERACINLFLYDPSGDVDTKTFRKLCISEKVSLKLYGAERAVEVADKRGSTVTTTVVAGSASTVASYHSPHYFENLLTKDVLALICSRAPDVLQASYLDYRHRNDAKYADGKSPYAACSHAYGVFLSSFQRRNETEEGGRGRWWEKVVETEEGAPPLHAQTNGYYAGLYLTEEEKSASLRLKSDGLSRVMEDLLSDPDYNAWWDDRWKAVAGSILADFMTSDFTLIDDALRNAHSSALVYNVPYTITSEFLCSQYCKKKVLEKLAAASNRT